MSLYGSSVEYGLHCLLYLADAPDGPSPSSRDLAEFQGISSSFVAKLFTRLEKAGLVASAEGIGGGFRLARAADSISVLDVTDALEENKALFDCKNIRSKCVLYGDRPPQSETSGVCSIHAVMLEAEARMRASLAETSLADLAGQVRIKLPAKIHTDRAEWFHDRQAGRRKRKSNSQGK
jgi:Rrf2 family protein